jgi:RNA recognition motif-containing protein
VNTKVYVGNLPWTTTEEELTEQFGTYGTVTEAKVVFDRETGRSKGFAFVTFEDESGADKAIASLDGQEYSGRMLKVSVAENRPRRPRENSGGYDRGDSGGYNERGNDRGGSRSRY